jgi:hypothetical protein
MTTSVDFLRTMIDHLNIGLVIVDKDNRIVIFNHLAGEMLQQDPQERVGSSIFSCHPRESDQVVAKLISDLKSHTIDHYEGWVNYRGRMLFEFILPIWDDGGDYIGMIEELHDAAEKVELLQRLGQWKDIHISGMGARQPRDPESVDLLK